MGKWVGKHTGWTCKSARVARSAASRARRRQHRAAGRSPAGRARHGAVRRQRRGRAGGVSRGQCEVPLRRLAGTLPAGAAALTPRPCCAPPRCPPPHVPGVSLGRARMTSRRVAAVAQEQEQPFGGEQRRQRKAVAQAGLPRELSKRMRKRARERPGPGVATYSQAQGSCLLPGCGAACRRRGAANGVRRASSPVPACMLARVSKFSAACTPPQTIRLEDPDVAKMAKAAASAMAQADPT